MRRWSKADAPAGSEAGGRAPPGGRRRWAQPGATDFEKSGKLRRGTGDLPMGPHPDSNPILQIGRLRTEGEQGWVRSLSNRELQDTRS